MPAGERGDARSPEDDAALVVGISDGRTEALAVLYDRHAARLLGLALRILDDRRDAEDLLHDVFLEVWRSSHGYDPARASVGTWLTVKLRSRALDRRRAVAVARRFGLGTGLEAEDVRDLEADLGVLRGLDRARALEALESLPQPQRRVVSMMYLEGRSCSEIARRCGVPEGTVKSRLARGLALLRDRIREPVEGG